MMPDYVTGTFSDKDKTGYLAAFQLLRPFLNMETGPWIAGGSVRKLIMQEQQYGDIDVFVPSQQAAFAFIKSLQNVSEVRDITVREEETSKTEADPGIRNLFVSSFTFPVQVIYFKSYTAPTEILESFDFTVCQAVSDGENWIADTRMIEDAKNSVLRFSSPQHFGGSVARVAKYLSKQPEYHPVRGLLRQALRTDDWKAFDKLISGHLYLATPQCIYDKEPTLGS